MSQDRSTATTDTTTAPPDAPPVPAGVPPLPPGAELRPGAPPLPAGMPPLPEPAPTPPLPGASAAAPPPGASAAAGGTVAPSHAAPAPTAPPVEPDPPRAKGPSWNQGDFGVWLPGEQPTAPAGRAATDTPTATAPAPGAAAVAAPPAAPASPRRTDVPKRLRVHRVELASPWRRIVARIVDWVVVVVCFSLPLVLLILSLSGDEGTTGGPSLTTVLLLTLLAMFGPALYEIVGIAVWGQTVGKWLLGVRVVDARRGDVPGWSESAMRWAPTLVTLLPLLGGVLSLGLWIWSLVNLWANTKRQTPFDLFAGTVVIKDR